jgi:hypothetical protein
MGKDLNTGEPRRVDAGFDEVEIQVHVYSIEKDICDVRFELCSIPR